MSKRSKSLPPAKLSMEETEKLFELLKGLSPREQATIRPVLERDLEFQRREKARIRHLKAIASTSEMKPIRERDRSNSTVCSESTESTRSTHSLNELLTPSTTPESQSGRVCCHCHCQLGLIFNAGTRCSQCRRLLCSNCRREGARSKWFCSECYLQRELRAASGEWVDNGGATEISSLLLEQMHRAAAEKRQQQNKQDVSKRSLAAAIPSPSKSLNFERNSKTLATISNENLLHPTNVRPPLERQSENSLVDPFDNVVQEVPRGGQNQSSAIGHHREMLSSQNSNDSSLMSDSAMWRGKPQTVNRKTVGKSEPSSLSPPKHREAASDSRRSTIPGRPMVVGGVVPRDSTGNFGSIAKVDHLDVLVGNSCRSPPASMVTRSASQDTRLSRVSRMTPASSRDSLRSAVTHTTDDTPNDFRGKSSVALQAPYPVAFLGEIQLALSYDVITACLSVHIVQCRSLPHFGNHKPNPYVKVLLVPWQANLPVLRNKTNARKSDFNPIFDQNLQFPRITKSEVDEYRMQVSVWHKDLISQNSLIGELTITLRDYNWANPSPLWYRLEAKTVGIDQRRTLHHSARLSKSLISVHFMMSYQDFQDALTNQSPWKMMKASVRVRLTFSLLDRERRIGPLSLLVRDVHFYEARQVQVVHRHATLVASAKLYFNEKRMVRRKSESIRRELAECQWNWSTTFPRQNLNDLHLRSLKLKIKLQTGPFGSKWIGMLVFNDYDHRRGRCPSQLCGCVSCSSWRKLINNPSIPVETELPLTTLNK